MKTLVKLALAALILHGTLRAMNVYWRYYQFRDGVQHSAQFSGQRSEAEVQAQIMDLAKQLAVPVAAENVTIRRLPTRTQIDADYTDQVQLLPTKYCPWHFQVNVDALILGVSR